MLVRGGLTLLSRNLALFTPSEMWWWCGSKVTIRGMFLSVVGVDLVVIRSSLCSAAALVWASKSSFLGVASLVHVGYHVVSVSKVVFLSCADSADTDELAVRDCLLVIAWVEGFVV